MTLEILEIAKHVRYYSEKYGWWATKLAIDVLDIDPNDPGVPHAINELQTYLGPNTLQEIAANLGVNLCHQHYSVGTVFKTTVKNESYSGFWDMVAKEQLGQHRETADKKSMSQLFPCSFTDGHKRGSSVGKYGLCILDIDNKGPGDVYTLEAGRQLVERLGCAAVIHTTWSHQPDAPRYRVIMPLARNLTAKEYTQLQKYFYLAIKHAAFDQSSVRNAALGFLKPSCATGTADDHRLILVKAGEQSPLDVDALADEIDQAAAQFDELFKAPDPVDFDGDGTVSVSQSSQLIHESMHRRERLMRIIFAEYMQGQTDQELVAQRVLDFDLTYHGDSLGGPYFTDYKKRPEFGRFTPAQLASKMVEQEYRSLANRFTPKADDKVNSIFGW